jgi:hypothetical protein
MCEYRESVAADSQSKLKSIRIMKIAIEDINSAGITAQARKDGITEVTKLASGPNVTIYQYGDVRVADTNGEPVWEESVAGEDWLAMLEEEGIDL